MKDDQQHFARQLEDLTRRSYEDIARMGSLSADMTQARYMIENIHEQVRALNSAKVSLVQDVQALLGPVMTPPPLPRGVAREDSVDSFVDRVAAHVRGLQPSVHPLDPYDVDTSQIEPWLRNGRSAAE